MTKVKWDHIVHYVNDIEEPIDLFKEKNLIAFRGGSHKQWGTYNSLSYFDLTYIEFLGIENRDLVKHVKEPNRVVKDAIQYLPEHEALSRVALRTDNIEEIAARLRDTGLTLSPIMAGKRLDSKGELIEWKMMTIDGSFQGLPYPFVIQWKGTDSKRLKSLQSSGVIQDHPAGKTIIHQAIFTVSDPLAVAEHWKEIFHLNSINFSDTVATLSIGEQSFLFKKGSFNQLTEIILLTESPQLQNKSLTIGEGTYTFKSIE
ncbi:MAG: VOC family protein [Niallia nealsonii]|uniref:VOC family protein n=1 Tax=Niallia circulans TaxID=1397 RepID=A0A941GCU5_NIACI|nr:VOC family protein [Niallia circulans]MCB5237848.1 VOC family protein [Niallia circulans]MDU1845529.1 VOC family protein [Niallia nealsonii]